MIFFEPYITSASSKLRNYWIVGVGGKRCNAGIALLKLIMSFCVVLDHFWNDTSCNALYLPFLLGRKIAAPIFMVIAFLYWPQQVGKEYLKRRIWRLAYLHVMWTIIYFLFYRASITEFLLQLVFGTTLNRSMWFQPVAILLTILLYYVCAQEQVDCPSQSFRGKYSDNSILIFMLVLAWLLQYTHINHWLWARVYYAMDQTDYVCVTMGRIVEFLPFAVGGVLLRNNFKWLRKNKYFCVLVFIVSMIMLFILHDKYNYAPGFNYSGIEVLSAAVFTVAFFGTVLDVESLRKTLFFIAKPTPGIYCAHRLIAHIIKSDISYRSESFGWCITLYGISWLVCFFISIIPIKPINKLVV